MKISQNWLKKFVDFKLTPEQFTEGLTMLGLEVESHEDYAKKYTSFVVGEVLERAKHPNADRLSFCKVNVGKEVKEIVCGAPNVAAGQKVAVALVGATIPHNQHDPNGEPFVLEKARIRGVESNGMICSAHELGLGKEADGILALDSKAKPGTPLAHFLFGNDIVYEIGITPNRADCLSHIGVAREVGLLLNKRVGLPKILVRESKTVASSVATVKIEDSKRCPRYSATVLRNVKIQTSPQWLQDALTVVGVRPINVVVDVTNYVMLELGQPLHAFDLDKLAGGTIIVKTAKDGDTFTTLDGITRKLSADTLMICDAEKQIAIGGVMGGQNSEIGESTVNVLIESAFFDPSNIRRTSRALGLSTEASYRFERGTDISNTATAALRAAQLIQELTGCEVLKGVIDVQPKKQQWKPIRLRTARVNQILGTHLSRAKVAAQLKKLQFGSATMGKDELAVTVPSYRVDVLEEIDLIEEVARVYGYENIETKTKAGIDFSSALVQDRFEEELRNYCVGAGFNEIVSISLQDENTASLDGEKNIRVLNPVSTDMQALRTNLVAGALQAIARNSNYGARIHRIFEIGRIYRADENAPVSSLKRYQEEERFVLAISGHSPSERDRTDNSSASFFDLKGEIEGLLSKFSLDNQRFIFYDTISSLTDLTVGVEINGTYAGYFGKVKEHHAKQFDIEEAVIVCELSLGVLRSGWKQDRKFVPLPKFPDVTRDLAFTVDETLPHVEVEKVLWEFGRPLIRSVRLFDVYAGAQTGSGKKSLAYALEFRSDERTLTDVEIEENLRRVVQAVETRCRASLRSADRRTH
jgi:phenylalanyl-tRNA synthetase beta chain